MMYEKLVRMLRNCGTQIESCNTCDLVKDAFCSDTLMKQAANAIEDLQQQNGSAYSKGWENGERSAESRTPKWISVRERLPEERLNPNTLDFVCVLCATIWGDVRPFKFGSLFVWDEPHFWDGGESMDKYVTHWMPLPEPPKEELA